MIEDEALSRLREIVKDGIRWESYEERDFYDRMVRDIETLLSQTIRAAKREALETFEQESREKGVKEYREHGMSYEADQWFTAATMTAEESRRYE